MCACVCVFLPTAVKKKTKPHARFVPLVCGGSAGCCCPLPAPPALPKVRDSARRNIRRKGAHRKHVHSQPSREELEACGVYAPTNTRHYPTPRLVVSCEGQDAQKCRGRSTRPQKYFFSLFCSRSHCRAMGTENSIFWSWPNQAGPKLVPRIIPRMSLQCRDIPAGICCGERYRLKQDRPD